MRKIVAIHQPDFMPWIGFFVKIWRSDTFVILDHTVNNVRDGSWFRRVKFNLSGQETWVSIPIVKPVTGSFQSIKSMEISNNINTQRMFKKYTRSLEQSYSSAPYYAEFRDLYMGYFDSDEKLLSKRNITFIKEVFSILSIKREVVLSSEINPTGASNELLVDIIKKVGANAYLSGDGADGYQDESIFKSENIKLLKNSYFHKEYNQDGNNKFMPGLSILDALFNIGSKGTKELIQSYDKY